VIAALNIDGTISYTATSTDPTVVFDYAYLKATATAPSTPDGGATAMLLGIGFLGAAGLRQKLS
jgi:hypothetical protein